MSTITRTLKNLWKIGIRDYFKQLNTISDTKYGTLVGQDKYGNKYYENTEEYPLRHRWVMYNLAYHEGSQVESGWASWLKYMVDEPPTQLEATKTSISLDKSVPIHSLPYIKPHTPNLSFIGLPWQASTTRKAFKTYSTTRSIYETCHPEPKARASR